MFVYIVTFEQRAGLVKIGCSKNPNVRFRGLEAHHGKVEPSASWATDFNHYDVENWLHNFYFDKRVYVGGDGGTEFFELPEPFDEFKTEIDKLVKAFGCTETEKDVLLSTPEVALKYLYSTNFEGVNGMYKSVLAAMLACCDKRFLYGRGIDTLIEFSGFKKTTVHAALNYLKCENIVERLDRHVMKINVERLIVL